MPIPKLGRLLIVDDEIVLANALSELLTAQGYDTVETASGQQALEALQTQEFDLLLTDLKMPGMDGVTLLEAALGIDPNLIGIIMTGHGAVSSAVDAMKVGAFDYILKPFKLNAMLPILSRAMQARRLRVENVQLRDTIAIYELGKAIAFTLDSEAILDKVVDSALSLCEADEASIMLPTPDGSELYVAAVRGERPNDILGVRVPIDQGIAGWVARYRETLTLDGKVNDPRFAPIHPRPDIAASVSMPILAGSNLIGVLNVNCTQRRRPLTPGQIKALAILVGLAAPALEAARLYEEARQSDAQHQLVLDNVDEIVYKAGAVKDKPLNGSVLFVSGRVESILGYKPQEFIRDSRLWMSIIHPDDRPSVAQATRTMYANQQGAVREYRVKHKVTGEYRWMEDRVTPQLDEAGRMLAIFGVARDITERRQAEDRLQFQADILRNVHDSVIVTDLEGKIVYWNEGTSAIFGYSAAEMLGQTPSMLYPDLNPEQLAVDLKNIMEGRDYVGDWKGRCKDGATVWVAIKTTLLRDAAGRATGFIGVAKDITGRRQIETEINLLLSVTQAVGAAPDLFSAFRVTLEKVCEATGWDFGEVWLPRPDGSALELCPAWFGNRHELQALRRISEEVTFAPGIGLPGRVWLSRQPEWIPDVSVNQHIFLRARPALESGLKAGLGVPVTADGQVLAVFGFFTSSTRAEDQRLIEIVSAVAAQLGEALQRKRAEEALRKNEERFRSWIENSSDLVTVVGLDGAIQYESPSIEHLLGYKPEDLVGANAFDLMHPDDRDRVMEVFAQNIQQPEGAASAEFRLRHRDGSWRVFEGVGRAYLDEHGQVAGLINSRDITERKRAEEALRDSQTQIASIFNSAMDAIITIDEQQKVIIFNPAAEQMFRCAAKEAIGQTLDRFLPETVRKEHREYLRAFGQSHSTKRSMKTPALALTCLRADGEAFPSEISVSQLELGGRKLYTAIVRDATERVRAEEALRESQKRYELAVEATNEGIWEWNPVTNQVYSSPRWKSILGFEADEFPNQAGELEKRLHPDDREKVSALQQTYLDGRAPKFELEFRARHKDGSYRWIHSSAIVVRDANGKPLQLVGSHNDITERKQAEDALRSAEARYRALFDQSPNGVLLIDAESAKAIEFNDTACKQLGYTREEFAALRISDYDALETPEVTRRHIQKVLSEGLDDFETLHRTQSGEIRNIHVWAKTLQLGERIAFYCIFQDITDRKQAEQALARLHDLLDSAGQMAKVGGWELDLERQTLTWTEEVYRIHEVDPATRLNVAEAIDFYAPAARPVIAAAVQAGIDSGTPWDLELPLITAQGRQIWVRAQGAAERRGGRIVRLYGAFQDITRRKEADESRSLQSAALNSAANAIVITDRSGVIEWVNPAFTRLTGYAAAEAIGRNPSLLKSSQHDLAFYQGLWATILSGQVWRGEIINRRKDGSLYTEEQAITPVLDESGAIAHFVAIKNDITQRKQADEQIEAQFRRMAALRAIDTAITSSLDLRVMLNVVLEQTTAQLGMHAASVLLLNPHTLTLEYAAGRGFRTDALKHARLRLGEGQAGRAALERQLIHIPDLRERKTGFLRSPYISAEGFVAYYVAPLIAKGNVVGVLEVYHRAPYEANDEWRTFLETLAGQAAIAVDNAQLFENLQRANVDLVLAYDATIEGWSYALDLRDKETEGHTQRVTELTLRLAREMGIDDAELVHIRRGALLHDIGKMGIPDSILLKPGPLNDEEWVIMKKHPAFAFDMLSPIAYLQHALDIPYCHHEQWNGAGYPRGLKGEGIPLAARIFAVVDVYDALRSDRPYRAAWPDEKVREHIREQAGQNFDPAVVEVFLKTIPGSQETALG